MCTKLNSAACLAFILAIAFPPLSTYATTTPTDKPEKKDPAESKEEKGGFTTEDEVAYGLYDPMPQDDFCLGSDLSVLVATRFTAAYADKLKIFTLSYDENTHQYIWVFKNSFKGYIIDETGHAKIIEYWYGIAALFEVKGKGFSAKANIPLQKMALGASRRKYKVTCTIKTVGFANDHSNAVFANYPSSFQFNKKGIQSFHKVVGLLIDSMQYSKKVQPQYEILN